MALDMSMIALVLLAAALHATWNALVKSSEHRVIMVSVIAIGGGLICLAITPFVAFPDKAAWGYLITSVLVHYLYYLFLLLSYRVGDLSHVYPISRGIAPLLVAGGAFIFIGEILSLNALAGMCLASIGIISLAFGKGWTKLEQLQPVAFALATGFFIACYTLLDGAGVRLAGDRIGYISWLFVLEGIPFLIWAIFWRARDVVNFIQKKPLVAFGGTVFATTAYGLVIFVMSMGAMAHVSALRETSTILASIIGVVILKESFGIKRIFAAICVASGVIIMNIA